MYKDNEINNDSINNLRSSIDDLRDYLYVRELKKDLKEFVQNNVILDENQNFLKTEIITDAPYWFPKAHLSRTQSDLIAKPKNGEEQVFQGYFNNHDLPAIETENGLMFNGALIDRLAGPIAKGQYAQASSNNTLSIGEVSSITGTANAKRLDGSDFVLSKGDPVFQGDTISVSNSGAIGLTFLDKTTLSLSEGGKMVLDELVYDPSTGTGSMAVDMVEGAFSFISGEIAQSGEDAMTIKTPVATVGIRGTTVAGKAAVEGNENSFTLLQDADGGVGQISVSNAGGTQVLAQVGATTSIASFTAPPPPPVILSAAQIQANYGTALNVLPPTPVVAPTPQEPPPPQEEQEEVQDEAVEEESDETSEEESTEEVSEEEDSSEEGLEEVAEEEGVVEEELLEVEEDLPEEGLPLSEEVLAEEGTPPPEEGEGSVPTEERPLEGDQQAAREAFDTALAAGESPEQAMAEAAVTGGFNDPVTAGGGSSINGEPLLGGPIPGIPGSGIDPLGGSPLAPTLTPGLDGPVFGSPLASGPMNFGQGPVMGPILGSGPAFGTSSLDTMGVGSIAGVDPFLNGASGFGNLIFGTLEFNTYGAPEIESVEAYFFDDPSLYDDFKSATETETVESTDTSSSANTFNGTNSNDTIDKSSETNSVEINGLDGNDTINGGINNDTIDGGDGDDSLIGNQGDDILKGGSGNDTLLGGGGEDKLIGGEGDDILKGDDGDDIIAGGIGSDVLHGNNGDDKFYFLPVDVDGNSRDEIADFRTNGQDLIVSSQAPTSVYNRKQIHVDSTQNGSNYDITTNSNELPYVFNFTYDVATAIAENTTGIANHLTGFSIGVSGTGSSLSTDESMYLAIGDGTDTYIYFWTDTNNHHGMIAESELDPVVKLSNFDNDNLDGSEFTFQTISGV